MEKDFDNIDKKEYLPPVLVEYGTVDSITKGGGPGLIIDSLGPGHSNVTG
jgi:hypothetical protein